MTQPNPYVITGNPLTFKDAEPGNITFTLGEDLGGFSITKDGIKFIEPFEPNTESVAKMFELMTNIIRTSIPLKLKCCKRDGDNIILESDINNYSIQISDLKKLLKESEVSELILK